MKAYLKSKDTFAILEPENSPIDVDSYDNLPVATATIQTGNIKLAQALASAYENQWVMTDTGELYVVESTTTENGITKLKVSDAGQAFDREIVYSDTMPQTFGEFIAHVLLNYYRDCTDQEYDMPYLSVTNTDTTPFVMPKMEYNRFMLSDIINLARQNNVAIDFSVTGNRSQTLSVRIYKKTTDAKNIIFGDGHSEIQRESYNRSLASKVTISVAFNADEVTTYQYYTFYLLEDGTITDVEPAQRLQGTWVFADITHEEDDEGTSLDPQNAYNKAVETFAKNINSHKISFYSDRSLNLYDTVNMLIGSTVYSTQITAIQKSSTDKRNLYVCGEMAVTLTEKIAKLENAS